jgi:hypothetical protein
MSDTPRTDAETWRDEMDHVDTDYTFAQSVTVSADFARQLERELAEAREELSEWRTLRSWGGTPQIIDDFIKGQQSRIHAAQDAEKQRDTLADALEMVTTHTYADGQCDNGYSPQYVAKQALAAVKGGQHD